MIFSLTVELKNGQRYDAQNIQVLRKGWGADFQKQVITFECSGVQTTFDAEDVKDVTYNRSEALLPTSV